MSAWFPTDALEDGWYWWRASDEDTKPGIVQVCNGWIIELRDGEEYEHKDFSGEWVGPLDPPE